jgi:REP element-mobilizing transposase RayT
MTLFKNKYRIESTRLKNWNYASAGWHFITICTKNRELFFGDVKTGDMVLSATGEIVSEEWLKAEEIRSNVDLDEWIVMPNHVHGIIVLTHTIASTSKGKLKANSASSIIGQFKSACTKRIWASGLNSFDWQPRFYDEIIRSKTQLTNIRQYIANNPLKWELDKDNPASLWM